MINWKPVSNASLYIFFCHVQGRAWKAVSKVCCCCNSIFLSLAKLRSRFCCFQLLQLRNQLGYLLAADNQSITGHHTAASQPLSIAYQSPIVVDCCCLSTSAGTADAHCRRRHRNNFTCSSNNFFSYRIRSTLAVFAVCAVISNGSSSGGGGGRKVTHRQTALAGKESISGFYI